MNALICIHEGKAQRVTSVCFFRLLFEKVLFAYFPTVKWVFGYKKGQEPLGQPAFPVDC